ncbi:MAG: leucine-rich repeat-containing protein kinase family protein [Patescibacteria group bacterium]
MNDFPPTTTVLDLSAKNLDQLPQWVTTLKNLKVLFLSNNNFKKIPQEINQLENLEFLGMKSCQLTTLEINSIPKNIRWLTLTDNKINKIPKDIGQLEKLEKLLLAGNQITAIPEEIIDCKNLALLRISANKLKKSPFSLIKKLPNLAWYADAGNPFSLKKTHQEINIPKINWADIKIKSMLGASAQNKIYQTSVKGLKDEVAIKIFGSKISSDGYPQDDLIISILAGKHPNIIETLFEITDEPTNKFAIALKKIDKKFLNLGFPPSFATCYRDTFAENQKFTSNFILKVLQQVSSAYTHLHQLGIMNGDLYAHNILTKPNGETYLGDFGAASLYDKDLEPEREAIDVRAFGFLIADLLDHTAAVETENYHKLEHLKNLCLATEINKRPTFKKINSILKNI